MDRSRSASIGELRAASAPPRGLLVNSGPHMMIFNEYCYGEKMIQCEGYCLFFSMMARRRVDGEERRKGDCAAACCLFCLVTLFKF